MSRRPPGLEAAYQAADFESKAKTEFLNRMSHDVRTPINGIMGMLDIIRSHRDDEARVDDCLQKIQLSCQPLASAGQRRAGHEQAEIQGDYAGKGAL